ncbi:MAG: hypothetical protein IJF65_02515 [Clostridia bacterium]|nr:hypothetical protein [Clostridia bacterium]
MKKSLQKTYWVSAAITLVMALVAALFMLILRIDDKRESLHAVLEAASAWTLESQESLAEHAQSIAELSPPVRVTYLMAHGLVLADSHQDPMTLPLHYDRPEVVAALKGETGESLRFSSTMNTFELYAAKKVSPYLILRLGYPMWEITQFLFIYAIGIGGVFLILQGWQRRALNSFSKKMLRQMEDVRLLLAEGEGRPKAVFPELQGDLDHIAYLAQRLHEDLEEVRRTQTLRSDFVANASHELRSPLTSIMGFAEMLTEGLADTPQEQTLCLSTIRSECERMLAVIEEILLLSRAERQQPEKAPVEIHRVIREVCQALSLQAAEKRITLSYEGEWQTLAPEKDVWEVLFNLIDNAIRYGREGGWVKIFLEKGRLTVEDNGVGVAAEHLPRLFEQFYRVDEARQGAARGTGLGLSIVKALVERNGGQITVESQVNVGTRFIVTFEKEGEN